MDFWTKHPVMTCNSPKIIAFKTFIFAQVVMASYAANHHLTSACAGGDLLTVSIDLEGWKPHDLRVGIIQG